jgi:hypothetical protein
LADRPVQRRHDSGFLSPSEKAARKAKPIPLCEADRQKKYDHTACLYVPAAPLKGRSGSALAIWWK